MKAYKIRKNKHNSTLYGFLPHIGWTFKDEIKFKGSFDKSCLYKIDSVDGEDINKFYGLSTSWFHKYQSVRLGWRCLDGNKIQLLTFCHDTTKKYTFKEIIKILFTGTNFKNILPSTLLDEVYPNEEFECTIQIQDTHYVFIYKRGDIEKVVMVKKGSKGWNFKYKLYPYFGGDLKSPHKMWIRIKNLF